MSRLRNIFACLALWLVCEQTHAQVTNITIWSDNFDTNGTKHWISTFDWQVGQPNAGPPVNAKGFRTFSGANCGFTAGYAYNSIGLLYCNAYFGTNFLVVPDASLTPTLNFWQWYNFANALGFVVIYTESNGWQQVSGNQTGATGGWALSTIDISAFAGQRIKIGFEFESGGCCGNNLGWFVDDVSVTELPAPPSVDVPDTQTIQAGQTLSFDISASNDLLPNDTYTFRLPSLSTNYFITTAGNFSWTNTFISPSGIFNWTNAASPGTNLITIIATDTTTPALTATNSFTLIVLPPQSPTLNVPPAQTIALGQTLVATNSATNSILPLATYTFSLLPLATNLVNGVTNIFNSTTNAFINTNSGVFTWTNTAAPSGTNFVSVVVKDNSRPALFTTNFFAVIISPAPQLIVPSTQTLHAGQTLAVTISATNAFLTGSVFTFGLPSASTNYSIATNTGVLTWTNTFISTNNVLNWTNSISPGTNTIFVTVRDNSLPPMSATNSFSLVILPPVPPTLIVPGSQTIFAGQTLVVTNFATNSILTNCTFTFAASGPPGLDVSNLATNGVLRWATTTTQPLGTYSNIITVTDNSVPPLSATNSFAVTVQSPPPPTLIVPPTQAINVGQTMVVTNFATNSVFPNAVYTYSVAFGPTNLNLTAATGVLKWTPTAAQGSSINNIFIKVTDNNSPPLSTIQGFLVLVSPAPPLSGSLAQPAATANGFRFTLSTLPDSNWRIDASTNLTTWLPVFTNMADSAGTLQFTDPLSTNFLHRYYRAVSP